MFHVKSFSETAGSAVSHSSHILRISHWSYITYHIGISATVHPQTLDTCSGYAQPCKTVTQITKICFENVVVTKNYCYGNVTKNVIITLVWRVFYVLKTLPQTL